VQPTPVGIEFARMVSPTLALATNNSSLMLTDGGDFTYLQDIDVGPCTSGATSDDTWLLCKYGMLRIGASVETLPLPGYGLHSLVASADGGLWARGASSFLRYQSPGWVSVSVPSCSGSAFLEPLGAREALLLCNVWPPLGTQYNDLYRVEVGTAPALISSIDGGASVSARSPDSIFLAQYDPYGVKTYQMALDGGLTPFATAHPSLPVRFASDGQMFQINTSLYRVVNGSWSTTQTFAASTIDVDLWGNSGVQVYSGELTFFSDAGQATLGRSSVPSRDRVPFSVPVPIAGPRGPRFVFGSELYELDAGALVPSVRLARTPSSAFTGLVDGGFAYVDSSSAFVRYSGGAYTVSAPLPARFGVSAAVPTPRGGWLLAAHPRILEIDADGGLTAFNDFDAGSNGFQLRAVSDVTAVVIMGSSSAVIDLTDGSMHPAPWLSGTWDVCTMSDTWFLMTGSGLKSLPDGGAWRTWSNTPNSGDLVCWPERNQVYAVETGQLFDVSAGVWLAGRSPTVGRGLVASDGRLWVTGAGGTVVVRQ
jgi:hypothetical protein